MSKQPTLSTVTAEDQKLLDRDLISQHTFLLPFKWSNDEGFPTSDDFLKIQRGLAASGWSKEKFDLNSVANYNEFHYFYDYVREVLYEMEEGLVPRSQKNDDQFILHFNYKNVENGNFYIQTPIPFEQRDAEDKYKDGSKDITLRREYVLHVDSVLLHLYHTGVGVLSYHLHNREDGTRVKQTKENGEIIYYDRQDRPEDILYINQYGRRVYPPFYRIPHEMAGQQGSFRYDDFTEGGKPHGGEIAYQIGIEWNGERINEDWSNDIKDMFFPGDKTVFKMAAFIKPFLGIFHDNEYRVQSILDDRMFTLCWYGNDELSRQLNAHSAHVSEAVSESGRRLRSHAKKESEEATELNAFVRNHLDWWYKFVYVDAGMVTVQNQNLRNSYLDQSSYLRWAGYGTYYGITDYSFVLLTGSMPQLRNNYASYLVTHLQTIYFRLSELVLVQRACVQRFSDEVTHISRIDIPDIPDTTPVREDKTNTSTVVVDTARVDRDLKRFSKRSNELYKRYIRFINRVYFREVTAQIQGIELYQLLQRQARLPDAVEDLTKEVHELHNYVRQETDRQLLQSSKTRALQKIESDERKIEAENSRKKTIETLGALLIAPTILLSVHDLGFLQECQKMFPLPYFIMTLLSAGLSCVLAFYAINNRARGAIGFSVIIYIILLILPFYFSPPCNQNTEEVSKVGMSNPQLN